MSKSSSPKGKLVSPRDPDEQVTALETRVAELEAELDQYRREDWQRGDRAPENRAPENRAPESPPPENHAPQTHNNSTISNAEMQALFAAMDDLVLVRDAQGVCRAILTPRASDILYKSIQEMTGRSLHEVLPTDVADHLMIHIQQALSTQRTVWTEYCLDMNHQAVWLEARISPIDADSVILVARDITPRKQLELALQASETQLNGILTHANAAIISYRMGRDRSIDYFYYSAGCEQLYGYAQEEFLTISGLWRSRIHLDDWNHVLLPAFDELLATSTCTAEYRFHHQDGSLRWILEQATARWSEAEDCWVIVTVATDISQRKQAEVVLRTKEEQLRLTIELNCIGTWDWHLTTGQVEWNENLFRMFGLDPASTEPTAELGFNRIHSEDVELVQQSISRALEQHADYRSEFRVVYPDNTVHWLAGLGRGIYDDLGQAVRMVGVAVDISDRKRIEIDLKTLNQQLQQNVQTRTAQLAIAISAARMGTWESDLITQTEFWSAQQYALLGYRTDARGRVLNQAGVVLGSAPTYQLFLARVHPEDRERIEQIQQEALDTDAHFEAEIRLLWEDGTIHWHYSRGSFVYSKQGQPIKLVGIGMDISARKQAEEDLRQSEARLQQLAANIPGMIYQFRLSPNGDRWFPFISRSIHDIYGVDASVFLHNPEALFDLCHPDDLANLDASILVSLQTMQPWKWEGRFFKASGEVLWVQAASNPTPQPNGDMLWDGMLFDISDRKQTEDNLRASLQEKEVLLKEVHHRVKNNLQIISSLLRMQARQVADEQIANLFQDAQNRVHSMALIHEQLYQAPNLSSIDFKDYAQNLVSNLVHSYGMNQRIHCVVETNGAVLTVNTAIPCGLIINELVSNSLKYAFPNKMPGEVGVYLESASPNSAIASMQGILTIQDNGIGISPDINLQTTPTLGFRIVRNLANQIQGSITVDRHHGSRIAITFPLSSAPS